MRQRMSKDLYKLKIYNAGNVPGDPHYTEKFLEAENKLYEAVFFPVNLAACIPKTTTWRTAMKTAIKLMLQCDGILLLKDWKKSKGAKLEVKIAKAVGIPARYFKAANDHP
jgi:hypothetical protein